MEKTNTSASKKRVPKRCPQRKKIQEADGHIVSLDVSVWNHPHFSHSWIAWYLDRRACVRLPPLESPFLPSCSPSSSSPSVSLGDLISHYELYQGNLKGTVVFEQHTKDPFCWSFRWKTLPHLPPLIVSGRLYHEPLAQTMMDYVVTRSWATLRFPTSELLFSPLAVAEEKTARRRYLVHTWHEEDLELEFCCDSSSSGTISCVGSSFSLSLPCPFDLPVNSFASSNPRILGGLILSHGLPSLLSSHSQPLIMGKMSVEWLLNHHPIQGKGWVVDASPWFCERNFDSIQKHAQSLAGILCGFPTWRNDTQSWHLNLGSFPNACLYGLSPRGTRMQDRIYLYLDKDRPSIELSCHLVVDLACFGECQATRTDHWFRCTNAGEDSKWIDFLFRIPVDHKPLSDFFVVSS